MSLVRGVTRSDTHIPLLLRNPIPVREALAWKFCWSSGKKICWIASLQVAKGCVKQDDAVNLKLWISTLDCKVCQVDKEHFTMPTCSINVSAVQSYRMSFCSCFSPLETEWGPFTAVVYCVQGLMSVIWTFVQCELLPLTKHLDSDSKDERCYLPGAGHSSWESVLNSDRGIQALRSCRVKKNLGA